MIWWGQICRQVENNMLDAVCNFAVSRHDNSKRVAIPLPPPLASKSKFDLINCLKGGNYRHFRFLLEDSFWYGTRAKLGTRLILRICCPSVLHRMYANSSEFKYISFPRSSTRAKSFWKMSKIFPINISSMTPQNGHSKGTRLFARYLLSIPSFGTT